MFSFNFDKKFSSPDVESIMPDVIVSHNNNDKNELKHIFLIFLTNFACRLLQQ